MKKRLLSLALILCMALSLCACGTTKDTDTPAATEPGTTEGAAEIVLNLDGEPASLNPYLMGGSTSANLMFNLCYATLWRVNPDDSLSTDLAESYQIDAENMVMTVTLREGLTFADGSALTADDVVCSIKTEAADSGSLTSTLDPERTTAIDATTVQIGLKALSYATMVDLSCIGIISKTWTEDGGNAEKKAADILCSGPYAIEAWSTGNNMVYNKNANYWNAAQVKYNKVTVKCIGDETTRFLDYQNGDVDLCLLSNSDNIDSVEDGTVAGTLSVTSMQCVQGLAFDTEKSEALQNENLRLALCYAVDVESLVTAYCGSRYELAKSVFPATSAYYTEAHLSYDADLAKEYLQKYYDETGANSVALEITVMGNSLSATLAEALQYQYEQVLGINISVNPVDNATYFDAQAKGELICSLVPVTRGYYDPAKYMNSWISTSSNSIMHMGSTGLDELLNECINDTSLSAEARGAKLDELQQAVVETGKFLPMYGEIVCWALNGSISTLDNCVTGNGKLAEGFWLNEVPALLTAA